MAQVSAEQLDIFNNLTPEQQQSILQRVGGARSDGSASSDASSSARLQETLKQKDQGRRRSAAETEFDDRTFRASDTVVIEVGLPRKSAAQLQPQGQEQAPGLPGIQASVPTPAEQAAQQRRLGMVEALTPAERLKLDELIKAILSRNPYELDRNARLNLPGFTPIELGGLTEEQATQRLSLEPMLLPLEIHLSRLPLARTDASGLKPFGYDLFDNAPSTFSPVTDVPVPAEYVVGPGDQLRVQLFGSQNRNLALTVNRDGAISLPELGPVRVAGMTFAAAQRAIEARVSQQMIGVQASVSMGDMRSIRVFVLGEARVPGSYTVSGLATMTTALFASGGVKPIGSLRNIQLKRQGNVVRQLDLYDLLIRGDTSDDAKLLPGDVIFIPPSGPVVSVHGEVKRPAIYETRGETSLADLVRLAGGLTPEGDASRVSVTRIDANGQRRVINLNLAQDAGGAQASRNGDVLHVAALKPQLDSGVTLEGFVYRPGVAAWREGLRLTDVIGSVDELKPTADQRYILIRREGGVDRRVSVLSADLSAALAAPDSNANVRLMPRDRVTVLDLGPSRERVIRPLMEELKLQSALSRPTETVQVGGNVKVPGEYPLEPGMRISDLIRAGGSLDSSAYGGMAELARYVLAGDGGRSTQLLQIDLAAVRSGDPAANLELQPFDYLLIKETPNWADRESVTLRGEVRFPGTYPIRKGETLHQLLTRAGGLTTFAFPEGSAFTRRDLRELEQNQLDRLADRLRADVAALALSAANAGQGEAARSLQSGQALLTQLQSSKAVGRFVIDLPGLLAMPVGGQKDVVLRDGDELVIPRQRQEVTVIGEVQNATSHLFLPKLRRSDYIEMSGGTTKKADAGRIYVVRADGSVANREGGFLTRSYERSIKPGDTIVVPLDTERMPRLPFWQAVTQILYNVAISVAAVRVF
ncbi:MAG: SLBB domain-containing protein [Steroidobacteraceae bacterium]